MAQCINRYSPYQTHVVFIKWKSNELCNIHTAVLKLLLLRKRSQRSNLQIHVKVKQLEYAACKGMQCSMSVHDYMLREKQFFKSCHKNLTPMFLYL